MKRTAAGYTHQIHGLSMLELAIQRLPQYTVQSVFIDGGKYVAWVKEELFPVEIPREEEKERL